jgi:protein-S-isoprenylcysteine O-methyltransferase Ste14
VTTNDIDAAAVRLPPPVVALGAVLAGVLLDRYVYRLRLEIGSEVRVVMACGLALLALALIVASIGRFRTTGQDPKPWKPSPELISTGVYRYTRNPMYLALGLIQAVVGVALANIWILALVPAMLFVVYLTAIRHEERYLERKFGAAYTAYKTSVRRFI